MSPSASPRSLVNKLLLISICVVFVAVALVWASGQPAGAAAGNLRTGLSSAGLFVADKGGITPEAATIVVNSLSDALNGSDGFCTLREAIGAANNNVASGGVAGECAAGSNSGSDAISFTVTGTIDLTSALPDISSDMTITGPGSSQLTVRRSTGGFYRIFTVTGGTVGLSGMLVRDGQTPKSNNIAPAAGGGIQNSATLTMTDVVVTANQTQQGDVTHSGFGGGIFNTGNLTMINCSVTSNTTGVATVGGGGNDGGGINNFQGTLTMTNCVVSGNSTGANPSGPSGNGGGIYSSGSLTVTNTSVSNNNTSVNINFTGGDGGGIYTAEGQATLTNCSVTNNQASPDGETGFGGGIRNQGPMTLVGTVVSGNTGRVGGIWNGNVLTMTNTTVSGNHKYTAIESSDPGTVLTLTNCTITGNEGSGIDTITTPTVRNTIIAGNSGSTDVEGGTFNSLGHNLIGKTTDGPGGHNPPNSFTAPGDQFGTSAAPLDPRLGPLANNGGATMTHALLSNSTALDAADNCVTDVAHCGDANITQLTSDQRGAGFSRQVDGPDGDATATVDIGAYEMQTPLANLADASTNEDTQVFVPFDAGDTSTITSVTADSSNATLVPNDSAHLSVAITGSTGVVTINPATNEIGTTNITVTVNRSVGGPDIKTFLLTVNAVNDAPSFTKGADLTVNEDSGAQTVNGWATAISAGPNESGQTVSFTVTNNNNALFSSQPAVSSAGTLTYTPAADANGNATVTVTAVDNGGTGSGGNDTSPPQTFTITVSAVNDPPSFTKGADQTVNEDAGAQTVTPWATAISPGPNESGQTVSFTVTNNNNALFSSQPAVSSTGTLTYTPAANANGSANVTVTAKDNGGGVNDTSPPQTFTIAVMAVNDSPSFTKGADQTVSEDAGAQTVTPWATGISPGPANESGQTVTFTVTNNNNALFSSQPAVSSAGTLTYTPAADANGSATVTVTATDDAGGNDTSSPQTFTITVSAVNDPPSFTKGPDRTVSEDAGSQSVANWATGISPGPANESGQTVTFTVINNNNALFSSQPAVNSAGTLTFTPAANANGSATVTVTAKDNGGGANDTSAPQTFTVTVSAVNDPPSFTKGANQTVPEDAGAQTTPWATGISPGPTDETGQTVTFTVTNNNNGLFSSQPAVSSAGTLTYTPAADANGSVTVTVTAVDNGGTASGGNDTSPPQTFTITVSAINDPPSFTKGADQTVNEDAGAQTVTPWATGISPGPNESGQTVSFTVTNNNNPLFSSQPAVSSTGTLTYTPAANANGSATVTVTAKDNGGTGSGGNDTSPSQTFTITVSAINDPPSFTKGANQTVNEDSGAQTVTPWATSISVGPNETGQTVTFTVTNNNNTLFSSQPAVSSTGTLTFTPAADANGSATVTVTAKDDGGTGSGGNDTSPSQTFTITVTAINDAPSFTKGADQAVNNNAGAQSVASWATSISAGPANESGQTVTFTVTNNNNGLFSSQPAISSAGTLTYTPSASGGGTATITVSLKDNGGTANGGIDTSASQTFTITVTPVGGFVNFESSTGNTTENSGSTTVNVVRSNAALAATVNYATNADAGVPCSTANGVASPKCDFTTALGTLNFAAGETTKQITILISQDSFVEGPETITLTLSSPTGGAALGTTPTMALMIADDATEPPTNIIDDPNMFVRMHYHDFLNREADQGGLNFWTGQMTNCGSSDLLVCRVNVSGAFFLSIEFQQTGYLVERMYKTGYGDATGTSQIGGSHQIFVPVVRANEFLTDTQRLGRNVVVNQTGWEMVLENNKQAYALEFVQTSRFITAFPTTMTPTAFVDKLNTNAGGVLSVSERQTAINLFGNAVNTTNVNARAQALRQVAEDQDLYSAEFNRAFVLTEFIGYLRRNPNDAPESTLDYSGYDFWLNKLNENHGDYIAAEMVKAFISSSEYRQRFGP